MATTPLTLPPLRVSEPPGRPIVAVGVGTLLLLGMSAATASTFFHGIAFIVFQPVNAAVVVLALFSMVDVVRVRLRRPQAKGSMGFFVGAGLSVVAAIAVPLAGVWLLNEQGSGSAYLVALAFVPPALLIAAQSLLLSDAISSQPSSRVLQVLLAVSLVGTLGTPVLVVVWLSSEIPQVIGPTALGLSVVAVAADLAAYARQPGGLPG